MTPEDERAARYSDLFGSESAHTSDCAYCPICSGIGIARSVNPAVVDHLAAAARELMLAAGLFLEEAARHFGDAAGEASGDDEEVAPAEPPRIRRIDIA